MADNDVVARLEALLAEKEKKDTAVGTVMKNGGGAVAGAWVGGGLVGPIVAGALAPFTGGLSVLVAPALAIAGGVMGHKMSKDID